METYDVLVVGYGPVGRLLALLLGRRGRRVLALERQTETYPLPRAVHHDDEIGRILQRIGLAPSSIPAVTEPYNDFYEWHDADRDTLLRLDWSGRGPSGWNISNFFHQPSLERELDALVEKLDTVTVRWGQTATGYVEHDDAVDVDIADGAGESYRVRARYVVGADGANSTVRGWMGTEQEDLGYFRDWLVIDVVPHAPIGIDPPAWQLCDPRRPTTLVPGGPGRRRWEFMRLPHEDPLTFATPENVWRLLEPWGVVPGTAELERHALYTFQARWAQEWRRGRLVLAGDGAHLMPPFAGQGMCSGLRDVANLEWKLDLVLDGADDTLLDTYGTERAAHVRGFIEFSMELGNVICISDPDEAAQRDWAMKADLAAGISTPPRPLPHLGNGLHRGADNGHAATLSIQAVVRGESGEGLLDDVVGSGGALIASSETLSTLDHGRRRALADVGIRVVALGSEPGPGTVVDVEGSYTTWLAAQATSAVLVRPDFYVYGNTRTDEPVDDLVDEYIALVHRQDMPSYDTGAGAAFEGGPR